MEENKKIILFRGIRESKKWWKPVGYWWAENPYAALVYVGTGGELYLSVREKQGMRTDVSRKTEDGFGHESDIYKLKLPSP